MAAQREYPRSHGRWAQWFRQRKCEAKRRIQVHFGRNPRNCRDLARSDLCIPARSPPQDRKQPGSARAHAGQGRTTRAKAQR